MHSDPAGDAGMDGVQEQFRDCDDGCQYSKDVGMWPEHSCVNGCVYKMRYMEELREALEQIERYSTEDHVKRRARAALDEKTNANPAPLTSRDF